MSLEDQMRTDVLRFFENIESQDHNDKVKTLINLLDKYSHLSKSNFNMDYSSLHQITSSAKSMMANKLFPTYLGVSKIKIQEEHQSVLCIVESTISFLNKNDCLKRLPKFDYRTDDSF